MMLTYVPGTASLGAVHEIFPNVLYIDVAVGDGDGVGIAVGVAVGTTRVVLLEPPEPLQLIVTPASPIRANASVKKGTGRRTVTPSAYGGAKASRFLCSPNFPAGCFRSKPTRERNRSMAS
jgi:hypothetical protein